MTATPAPLRGGRARNIYWSTGDGHVRPAVGAGL